EAGPFEAEIVDPDVAVGEYLGNASDVDQARGRRAEPARLAVAVHLGRAGAQQRLGALQIGRVRDGRFDARLARLVFGLGRRSRRYHAAVVDHDDVVGEVIGFFQILRGEQQCGAVTDEVTQDIPQVDPAT